MNYSTLKKSVAFSLVSLMAVGAVKAQTATTPTAKVFGGSGQYNTWSLGVNVGATSPMLATGGSSDFNGNVVNLGYGVSVRDQLAHSFGLQLDVRGGKVAGNSGSAPFVTDGVTFNNYVSYSTTFVQGSLSGVVNVATIDYLRRKNAINFFATGGVGLASYTPTIVGYGTNGTDGATLKWPKHVMEFVIPIGVGAKFRLTDQIALNLGYTENFIDGDNFDGVRKSYPTKDRYSYGYAGLEFTLGPKSKPSLEWVNPVAMMYDELYDEALRQEVAALKGRVTNVENAVNDLKKDSDGDGVADQFDKCPGTPAGTVVDGSGCAIVFPKIDTSLFVRKPIGGAAVAAYSNIQFEFDSSVLRTSSYPVLDASSADLRASGSGVELDGYASSEGTAAHNMALSKDRANSVKTYLVNSGVDAKKVKIKAFGETHPIADNSTEEGRVLNRRVQFKKK
ncbi:OmpA family protein [Mucilaginibacter sp.]|uniref:OmpA family protein n=1 Tax=Mucilaginibacter sp. TaxID=1882438 RepID=UPI00261906F7|nr:OmpA family protein [Mucilaginibacter sp.]MDB5031061.1 OmpA family protein [Mucilaginibacter sp.]